MRGYIQNNKPKFVLLDIEAMRIAMPESDDRLDKAAKKK